MLRTRNNTDGNKLVIFSGIASYYGDNYIVLSFVTVYIVMSVHVHNNGTKVITTSLGFDCTSATV